MPAVMVLMVAISSILIGQLVDGDKQNLKKNNNIFKKNTEAGNEKAQVTKFITN